MNQSIAMLVGACVGAVIWLVFRGMPYIPGLFLSVVVSAWLALGLYGVVGAEVTIGGRGGKSPKSFAGPSARLVGLLIIAVAAVFVVLMAHTGN